MGEEGGVNRSKRQGPIGKRLAGASPLAVGASQSQLVFTSPRRDDSEPFHPELEGRAVHPQARCRALWPGDDPSSFLQGRHDMCTLRLLQSFVLPTILNRDGGDT